MNFLQEISQAKPAREREIKITREQVETDLEGCPEFLNCYKSSQVPEDSWPFELISSFSHPNLQQVSITGSILLSESLSGLTIFDWLTEYGPIGESLGKYFLKEIVQGLSQLHKEGVSHGSIDLKSIIFTDELNIKLTNFERVHKVMS